MVQFRPRRLLAAAALLSVLAACSSSTNPAEPTADASSDGATGADASTPDASDASIADAAPDGDGYVRDPSKNCVKPGTPNNDKGVGGYCTSTSQCFTDAGPAVCTADVMGTPDDAWFCTTLCSTDADCGTGARCFASSQGSGCVPVSCLGDAGSSGGDAGATDAATDALDQ